MDKVKFAIIGCGRIGERHAEHIKNFGELVAVCDIVEEKATELSRKYNAACFFDIDDLLTSSSFDVLSVCTPNGLHAIHSIKALRAGVHVLCEKPMAISSQDCKEMIQ